MKKNTYRIFVMMIVSFVMISSSVIIFGNANSANVDGDNDDETKAINSVKSKEELIKVIGFDPTESKVDYYDYDDYEIVDDYEIMIEKSMDSEPQATADGSAVEYDSLSEGSENTPPTLTGSLDGVEFSATNTQVEGVDEADIIKTDGEYIYYVRGNNIEIVKANSDGTLTQMSTFATDEDFKFDEIFIDGDNIAAIGSFYYRGGGRPKIIDVTPPYAGLTFTRALVIDTSNKTAPVLKRTVETEGSYITSRKIGKNVYFMSDSYIRNGRKNLLPFYSDSDISNRKMSIDYDCIYYFDENFCRSYTTVSAFSIDNNEKADVKTILTAGNSNVYMSTDNLFIAPTSLHNNVNMSTDSLFVAPTSLHNNVNFDETDIYKFPIKDGKIGEAKRGTVPGVVLNQFSMDEYDSYFRIATNYTEYKSEKITKHSNIYVLDNEMKIVGKVEGIAPNEDVYSARFMGKRAYLVTFEKVDPLFAIDLSVPTEPKIMGALKIPGYSDYLHPYDENHLIGFGKDTKQDEYGNAFYQGMKMSMFDVTDITDPKEMFVEIIGERGTESPLLYNHKALMFSREKELIAFPVSVYEVAETLDERYSVSSYGQFEFSGAYVYSVNLEDGFNLKGKLTHLSDEDYLKSSTRWYDTSKDIERLLYIGENLYTASQNKIVCNDLNSLKEKGKLVFETFFEERPISSLE